MRPRKRGDTWVYPKSADVLRAARLQPLRHYIQKRRATVARTIKDRPILVECRRAGRLRGSPVRPAWWEQDLTLPPEPEEEADDVAPGMGGAGPPRERRSSAPMGATSLREQQAARRAAWAARDRTDDGEGERMWAAAHLPSG